MTAAAIDTLQFARKLRDGGVDERTANTIAQEVGRFVADNTAHPDAVERIEKNMATKGDVGFLWWGIGVIIAGMLGVLWHLFAIAKELAALAAVVERIAQ
jgi:hypothetical protein